MRESTKTALMQVKSGARCSDCIATTERRQLPAENSTALDLGHGPQCPSRKVGACTPLPFDARTRTNMCSEEAAADRNRYLLVNCPACGKVHFLNRSTHKLLGHERE
jgi:hypothetical protein